MYLNNHNLYIYYSVMKVIHGRETVCALKKSEILQSLCQVFVKCKLQLCCVHYPSCCFASIYCVMVAMY